MSETFAKVAAKSVASRCRAYLEHRETRIEAELEEMVQKELSRRFFPARSREQALARLREAKFDLQWVGGFLANRAQNLIDLCGMSADGTIQLSTRDAEFVAGMPGSSATQQKEQST